MLRAGGSKRHKELLAPFGMDASDPAFWERGPGVVESFIVELGAVASACAGRPVPLRFPAHPVPGRSPSAAGPSNTAKIRTTTRPYHATNDHNPPTPAQNP